MTAMRAWLFAVLAALVLHAAILLFGGVFFMKPEEGPATVVEGGGLVGISPSTDACRVLGEVL